MLDPQITAAAVISVPSTVAALAAWRTAKKTHKEVRTNHGKRAGEYLEQVSEDLTSLKHGDNQPLMNRRVLNAIHDVRDQLIAHAEQDASNFASLTKIIAERN